MSQGGIARCLPARQAAAEPVRDAFRAEFSRDGEFAIYSNRSLRARILAVFDQTFAVLTFCARGDHRRHCRDLPFRDDVGL